MALWEIVLPPPLEKIRNALPWLPTYALQRCVRQLPDARPLHLVIGLADHFEPGGGKPADCMGQEQRVKAWCQEYPKAAGAWRDHEGRAFRHTYFYPAEQYHPSVIGRLSDHCHAGWGEIEIHLHHGIEAPDAHEETLQALVKFRDALATHGCLSRENGIGSPKYGFVHGNWALANSAHGNFCGVDDEMKILADTGCYADFTLPAPSCAQISKINAVYECALPLTERAPHRRGFDLQCGRPPQIFPLIVQGPLMIDFGRRKRGWPSIENGEISEANPATSHRLQLWRKAGITVQGRPDWLFIKLHCHGMAPGQERALLGSPMQGFLSALVDGPGNGVDYCLHFVTMREMVNIILAACDGRHGNPGEYRDYRFQLIQDPH